MSLRQLAERHDEILNTLLENLNSFQERLTKFPKLRKSAFIEPQADYSLNGLPE
jgi:hypothetical protein